MKSELVKIEGMYTIEEWRGEDGGDVHRWSDEIRVDTHRWGVEFWRWKLYTKMKREAVKMEVVFTDEKWSSEDRGCVHIW